MGIRDLAIGLAIMISTLGGVRSGAADLEDPASGGARVRVSAPRQACRSVEGRLVRAGRDTLVVTADELGELGWAWSDVRAVEVHEVRSNVGKDLLLGAGLGLFGGLAVGGAIDHPTSDGCLDLGRRAEPVTFCCGTGMLAGCLLGAATRPSRRSPDWQPMARPAGAAPYSVPCEPGLQVRVSAPAAGVVDFRARIVAADDDSLRLRILCDPPSTARAFAWRSIHRIETPDGCRKEWTVGIVAGSLLTLLGAALGATVVDDSGDGSFAGESRFEATMMGLGAGALAGLVVSSLLIQHSETIIWTPVRRPAP